MAKGGDGYEMLKTVTWRELPQSVPEVMIEYIRKNAPSPILENRITKQ
jgi:hypothetical protein